MKYYLAIIYTAMTMLFPLSVLGTDSAEKGMIKSIRYVGVENGAEIVELSLSRNIVPKYLELSGEKPRAVFDFINTRYSRNEKRVIPGGGQFIQKIRIGLHGTPIEKTRMVFDMEKNYSYQIDQSYIASNGILRITVTATPEVSETEPDVQKKEESEKSLSVKAVSSKQEVPSKTKEEAKGITGSAGKEAEHLPQQNSTSVAATKEAEVAAIDRKKDFQQDMPEVSPIDFNASPVDSKVKENPEINRVTWESSSKDTEMVLFSLNGFFPPVVFSSEEEELKVVCDFLDGTLGKAVNAEIDTGGKLIRKVRTAKFNNPEKVRVVLDLAENYNYDLKQVFFKEDNLFVLIISSLGEKE